jgi:parallel beta-helix repeat protein
VGRVAALLCVSIGLFLALAGAASAATTQVFPGPGAISTAVQAASPGDKIVVHAGTYHEAVAVDKPLTIVGDRSGPRPVVTGDCAARVTILAQVGGVSLRWLTVKGADKSEGGYPSAVDFTSVSSGSVRQLKLVNTCDAEYGVNVFNTGPFTIRDNEAVGFSDGGIYIGGVTDTGSGKILAEGNYSHGNNRGLIVEDSGGLADIVVKDNVLDNNRVVNEFNRSGIQVTNSNGVLIEGNVARRNAKYGIWLDDKSHDNHLFDNRFTHNSFHNVLDEGTRNCGTGNKPDAFECH